MANPVSSVTLPYQLLLSFALGEAASPAIRPFAQSLTNTAWAEHAVLPPDAYVLAQGVAQGQVPRSQAQGWANSQGISNDAFAALVDAANVGMPLGQAYQAWRRGLLTDAQFETQLHRLGIEQAWWPMLEGLHDVLLSPAELANARQQGFVDVQQQHDESALQGVTNGRADILYELAGLPPGVETALAMWRRGIIDEPRFAQIVREGHTKTKYTPDLEAMKRQLLSPATAVRLHLKGYETAAQMHARGADFGYTPDDMDSWFLSEGRPATAHQIHIGYARGATVPGATDEQDAIFQSVRESDIKIKYGDVIYAGRATYPSLFQLTRLVEGGTISADTGAEWAHKSGLAPEVVTALHQSWGGGGATSASDTHVSKAQTQLWTTAHRAYVSGELDDAAATTSLGAAGVSAAAVPAVLALWQDEQKLVRKRLSAAQVKKAWVEQVVNPATGQPWTKDEATAYLIESGYSANDAATFLEL